MLIGLFRVPQGDTAFQATLSSSFVSSPAYRKKDAFRSFFPRFAANREMTVAAVELPSSITRPSPRVEISNRS